MDDGKPKSLYAGLRRPQILQVTLSVRGLAGCPARPGTRACPETSGTHHAPVHSERTVAMGTAVVIECCTRLPSWALWSGACSPALPGAAWPWSDPSCSGGMGATQRAVAVLSGRAAVPARKLLSQVEPALFARLA